MLKPTLAEMSRNQWTNILPSSDYPPQFDDDNNNKLEREESNLRAIYSRELKGKWGTAVGSGGRSGDG